MRRKMSENLGLYKYLWPGSVYLWTHFNCEWVLVKGGKRPKEPPSKFPGVPKLVLKQVTSIPRPTSSTSESRANNCWQLMRLQTRSKISTTSAPK